MSESIWKNGKDIIRSNGFYSSVDWDILSRKRDKSKMKLNMNAKKSHVLIKTHVTMCYGMLNVRTIAFFPRRVMQKRVTKKQVKNIMVLNDEDKVLGLKSNEQHMRKDDFVNEHVDQL